MTSLLDLSPPLMHQGEGIPEGAHLGWFCAHLWLPGKQRRGLHIVTLRRAASLCGSSSEEGEAQCPPS